MSPNSEILVTQEGLDKLVQELEYLTTEGRREVAERIKEARAFGDISENSEYDDAKNDQAILERRIADLQDKVKSAKVINQDELDNTKVSVGSKIKVKDQDSGESLSLHIVGSTEASPTEGKISSVSPVGSALLGKAKNEIAVVSLPSGKKRKLKVTKIDA